MILLQKLTYVESFILLTECNNNILAADRTVPSATYTGETVASNASSSSGEGGGAPVAKLERFISIIGDGNQVVLAGDNTKVNFNRGNSTDFNGGKWRVFTGVERRRQVLYSRRQFSHFEKVSPMWKEISLN